MAKEDRSMLIFMVPAYNEEENIELYLQTTRKFAESRGLDYQIVIINDGSTDRTAEIIKESQKGIPIVLLDQTTNKGAGEAFQRGFAYVAEHAKKEDLLVTTEADNTSDLSILDAMLEKINDGYDMVLASCYMPGGNVTNTNIYRRVLSFGANFIVRSVTPLKGIHTLSSFYRLYRIDLIKRAHEQYGDKLIEEKGFTCMVELLLKLTKLHIRIAEVPMMLRGDLRKGKSKMKTIKTIVGYIRLLKNHLLHGKL